MGPWQRWKAPIAFACVLGVVAPAILAQPVTAGGMLTTPQGRTLYVFDNDVPNSGRSVCAGPCVGLHPPYLVEKGVTVAEPLDVVRRDDGSRQWSYKGRPLYLFYADDKPGDANGDGLNRGTWHIARP